MTMIRKSQWHEHDKDILINYKDDCYNVKLRPDTEQYVNLLIYNHAFLLTCTCIIDKCYYVLIFCIVYMYLKTEYLLLYFFNGVFYSLKWREKNHQVFSF